MTILRRSPEDVKLSRESVGSPLWALRRSRLQTVRSFSTCTTSTIDVINATGLPDICRNCRDPRYSKETLVIPRTAQDPTLVSSSATSSDSTPVSLGSDHLPPVGTRGSILTSGDPTRRESLQTTKGNLVRGSLADVGSHNPPDFCGVELWLWFCNKLPGPNPTSLLSRTSFD